ncbi:Isoamyl acetate-hydrolyzing esterase 1 [Teratosphaeria destructans]|uniref:Isoamyl acetate-hydrolyzing esterase 1 n=1 Tax=Teratosphaeria destructans TaxID=418781 RepID=A0A9W7W1M7_9PEZI|nr:Isoamyl acetate-hydrolyzing esterase 1 [Teratosphaeria destructans]
MALNQFVLFGDSITQAAFGQSHGFAFGAQLADVYARKLDIINRGLSGYNTEQALRALPLCVPDADVVSVRFLTIFFGANDSRIAGTPGGPDQCVPLENFKANLTAMVRHPQVTAHQDIRIILISPPPIDERILGSSDRDKLPELGRTTLRRTAANTALYAEAVREVGRELQVPVLDIWTAMMARAGYSPGPVSDTPQAIAGSVSVPTNAILQSYLSDGLHFSPEGYKVLYGELMSLIQREWPDQMPSRLRMKLPAWDDVQAWNGQKPDDLERLIKNGKRVMGTFEATVLDVEEA